MFEILNACAWFWSIWFFGKRFFQWWYHRELLSLFQLMPVSRKAGLIADEIDEAGQAMWTASLDLSDGENWAEERLEKLRLERNLLKNPSPQFLNEMFYKYFVRNVSHHDGIETMALEMTTLRKKMLSATDYQAEVA